MFPALSRNAVPALAMIAILGGCALVLVTLADALAPGSGSHRYVSAPSVEANALPFGEAAVADGLIAPGRELGVDDLAPLLNALHPEYVPPALVGLRFEHRPVLGSVIALSVIGAALTPLVWLALDAVSAASAPRLARPCALAVLLGVPAWVIAMQASGIRVLLPDGMILRSVGWVLYGACCLHLLAGIGSRVGAVLARAGPLVVGLYVVVFHLWRPAFLSRVLPEERPFADASDSIHAAFVGDGRAFATELIAAIESMPLALLMLLTFGVLWLLGPLETWLGRRHPLLPLGGALAALATLAFVWGRTAVLTPRDALEFQAILLLFGAMVLHGFRRREPLQSWLRAGATLGNGEAGRNGGPSDGSRAWSG